MGPKGDKSRKQPRKAGTPSSAEVVSQVKRARFRGAKNVSSPRAPASAVKASFFPEGSCIADAKSFETMSSEMQFTCNKLVLDKGDPQIDWSDPTHRECAGEPACYKHLLSLFVQEHPDKCGLAGDQLAAARAGCPDKDCTFKMNGFERKRAHYPRPP